MLLDNGIASVFREVNTAGVGFKPRYAYQRWHQGYYGLLSYETTPARPTDEQEIAETSLRIRMWRVNGLSNNDMIILGDVESAEKAPENLKRYAVTRVYQGEDEAGQEISDITLSEVRVR